MKKNLLVSLLLALLISALVCVAAMNVFAEETGGEDVVPPCTEHTPGPAANCQHAQTCTVCGERTTVEAHESNGPATLEAPEVCKVCGYELAPKLEPKGVLDGKKIIVIGDSFVFYGIAVIEKTVIAKHVASIDILGLWSRLFP